MLESCMLLPLSQGAFCQVFLWHSHHLGTLLYHGVQVSVRALFQANFLRWNIWDSIIDSKDDKRRSSQTHRRRIHAGMYKIPTQGRRWGVPLWALYQRRCHVMLGKWWLIKAATEWVALGYGLRTVRRQRWCRLHSANIVYLHFRTWNPQPFLSTQVTCASRFSIRRRGHAYTRRACCSTSRLRRVSGSFVSLLGQRSTNSDSPWCGQRHKLHAEIDVDSTLE